MSEPTEYLYRISPTRTAMLTAGTTPFEDAILAQHFSYLEDLNRRGVVLMAGRTLTSDEYTFGIVVFRASEQNEAISIMDNDPAVLNRVMSAELFPFRVALGWNG